MLKSRGRTSEVPVMGTEEWPQVDILFNGLKLQHNESNKDFGYD